MTARLIRFGIGLLAVVATTACGDPLATTATVATIEDTLAVYGLTEAPPSGPTALNTFLRQVVRTDPSQNFDIVFDISVDENTGDTVAYLFPAGAVSKFGTSGIIKDVVVLKAYQRIELDIRPDRTGLCLFHCHQQMHMDNGFKMLFKVVG